MRRGARGTTLTELLAAVALVGLVATVTATAIPRAWRQSHAALASADAFEERWLAIRQLRADVAGARTARLRDGWLLLEGGAQPVAWIVAGDGRGLVRVGTRSRQYRVAAWPDALLIGPRDGRTWLEWRLGEPGREVVGRAIVGGGGVP